MKFQASMKKFINRIFRRRRQNKNNPATASSANVNSTAQTSPSAQQHNDIAAAPAPAPEPAVAPAPAEHAIAQQPLGTSHAQNKATVTTPSLLVILVNRTSSATVYAYVTGNALNNNSAVYLLESDGRTPYYPTSPSSTGQPLQANCAIPLGAPGNAVSIIVPPTAGGRVWFSINSPLTFLLNPGPALVEPSVTNPSDPNINVMWGFCEFTYNSSQLYANISYVDFVSVPIALRLTNSSGGVQNVTGMSSTGLSTICAQLQQQSAADGVPGWGQCVVTHNGQILRALSPNNLMVTNGSAFSNYFEPYVQQVWQRYASQPLNISTSAVTASGEVNTSSNQLVLAGESFNRPSTHDIFTCSTGPFATGSDGTRNAIIPQLASAFNRSTLLETPNIPSPLNTFYGNAITNHYARIVHANQIDGRGYAFPYDDVNPVDGGDQSGEVNDPNPINWTITVGGGQYS